MSAGRVLLLSSQPIDRNARAIKTISALIDAGYEVQVAADHEVPTQIVLLNGDALPIQPVPRNRRPKYFPCILRSGINYVTYRIYQSHIQQVIETVNPDIIHIMDPEVLKPACNMTKPRKRVYDACEFFAGSFGAVENGAAAYISKLYTQFADKIDMVTTVSHSLANAHAKHHPELPPALVIENAAPFLAKTPKRTSALHKATGWSENTHIALFHGAFSKGRGLLELSQASANLPENWAIAFMGWGPLENSLRAKIGAAGKHAQIIPPVPYSDLMNYISGARIGLIPYQGGPLNHELATPNKLYEYAAAGVPILSSNLQELSARLETWPMGWTVDALHLETAIPEALAGLTAERLAEAQQAARRFHETINWNTEAAKLIAAYRQL